MKYKGIDKMKDNNKINKCFELGLYIFATGLMAFATIYWVRLISQNLWDDLSIRIIIMVLMIGAVICYSLGRVINNQAKILKCLGEISEEK